jgi:hypothetical protein
VDGREKLDSVRPKVEKDPEGIRFVRAKVEDGLEGLGSDRSNMEPITDWEWRGGRSAVAVTNGRV